VGALGEQVQSAKGRVVPGARLVEGGRDGGVRTELGEAGQYLGVGEGLVDDGPDGGGGGTATGRGGGGQGREILRHWVGGLGATSGGTRGLGHDLLKGFVPRNYEYGQYADGTQPATCKLWTAKQTKVWRM